MNVVTFWIKLLDIISYTYHTMGRDQILPLKPKTVFLLCKVYEGKNMGGPYSQTHMCKKSAGTIN